MGQNIVDLIVYFRGADSVRPILNDDVFPEFKLRAYRDKTAQSSRTVERIGITTNTIREASVIDGMMNSMRSKLNEQIRGRIFIYGSSSGGRNAIDLALRLSNNNIFCTYLGVLDAAFFPDETTSSPGDPLSEAPVFDAPLLTVFKRQNFYQLAANDKKLSAHGMIFTSDMANAEIHGKLTGFDNVDLTAQTIQEAGYDGFRATRAGNYHGKCIEIGLPKVQSSIAKLLEDI